MSMKLLRDDVGRSEHWAASRGWLYAIRGSGAEPELLRVLSGRFFGVAVHLGRVYVAGTGPSADGHSATYCGFIMSFRSAAGRLSDLRQEVVGLDNGVHQICVAVQPDGITFLYALETHAQRISGFRVLADGRLHPMARVIRPFPAAVNAWWVANDRAYASMRDALPEYLHANALTYHDGLFYVMCPRLRSQLDESGLPCNDPAATSSVRVFSEEWELLREYELDKRFCHDAVILGHQLRFLAASNELCSLDLVTGQVDTLVRLFDTHDDRAVCRGLSVSENGDATFSTTIGPDGRTGCFLVRISGDDVTVTDLPTTDTDGWSLTQLVLIHAPDYNQASGVLRAACGVHQVRLMTPMVQQMQEQFGVYLIGLEQMYKCRAPPRPMTSLARMTPPRRTPWPRCWTRRTPGSVSAPVSATRSSRTTTSSRTRRPMIPCVRRCAWRTIGSSRSPCSMERSAPATCWCLWISRAWGGTPTWTTRRPPNARFACTWSATRRASAAASSCTGTPTPAASTPFPIGTGT